MPITTVERGMARLFNQTMLSRIDAHRVFEGDVRLGEGMGRAGTHRAPAEVQNVGDVDGRGG